MQQKVKPMQKKLIHFCLFFCSLIAVAHASVLDAYTHKKDALLPPEQAFIVSLIDTTETEITLSVQIAQDYYLYRDQFTFMPAKDLHIGTPQLPQGTLKMDEFFGEQFVYEENVLITIPVTEHPTHTTLQVSYRGCASIGVCYPPMEQTFTLDFKTITNDHTKASQILSDRHFITALIIFFGLGLLLALTPCVLPMLPILSSIILGQQHLTRVRAFELSTIYVIAMAITFALAGVGAALLGASLQSSLQKPSVLFFSALILMTLAILLLRDYPLQLPHFISNKIDFFNRKQKRGTVLGVASMGVLSALVVSPCVTPPLIGALIYIAESGNVALGAGALLMLGLGMGVPLILLAVFGMHILPKQGPWLNGIKMIFALLLFALAIHLILRALPNEMPDIHMSSTPAFDYTLVKNVEDVNAQIQKASAQQQAVILDFYADWCVSCVKMEKTVFVDSHVQALLKDILFLKADVTANDEEDKALLQHFAVYGPPAILFFAPDGTPDPKFQLVGEVNSADFATHLKHWMKQRSGSTVSKQLKNH